MEKRGQIEQYLIWILIAVFVIGISMIVIFILKGQGISIIDKIKNLISGK